MEDRVEIPILGPLQLHPDVPEEWLISSPIPIPGLNRMALPFTLNCIQPDDAPAVSAAIDRFLQLDATAWQQACSRLFALYQAFAAVVPATDLPCRIVGPDAVWPHSHPREIFVRVDPVQNNAVEIKVVITCDWDIEHGYVLVFRHGNELVLVDQNRG